MADPTNKIYTCPIEVALDLIGGRWKPLILDHLSGGSLGFEELGRRIPLATSRMLAKQLRELERDGLLERKELAELPPPIEYALTLAGRRLLPALDLLRDVGLDYARRHDVLIHRDAEVAEPAADGLMLEAS